MYALNLIRKTLKLCDYSDNVIYFSYTHLVGMVGDNEYNIRIYEQQQKIECLLFETTIKDKIQ